MVVKMAHEGRSSDFPNLQRVQVNSAIETLTAMFGAVFDEETIASIVDSCKGDILAATEMAMEMTEDKKQQNDIEIKPSTSNSTPVLSYAGISKAMPLPRKNTKKNMSKSLNSSTEANLRDPWIGQIDRITLLHQQGYRTLILMRGLPGSGKSTLARKVLNLTVGSNDSYYSMHTFSTDNYFGVKKYRFNPMDLSKAHSWNQASARKAMETGVSPIIIDNTNLELWEMQAYVEPGVRHGYVIEILEPDTEWAKKPYVCAQRNKHSVDQQKLKIMLQKYTYTTVEGLLKLFKLENSQDLQPILIRNIPVPTLVVASNTKHPKELTGTIEPDNIVENGNPSVLDDGLSQGESIPDMIDLTVEIPSNIQIVNDGNGNVHDQMQTEQSMCEVTTIVEEFEKVSREWDKGASWEGNDSAEKQEQEKQIIPKPQRINTKSRESSGSRKIDGFLQNLPVSLETNNADQNLWDSICQSVPAWNTDSYIEFNTTDYISLIESKDASTQCENVSDILSCGYNKILNIQSRDINAGYIPSTVTILMKKIVTRDSSSMTDEEYIPCINAEKHFNEIKNIFKHVDEDTLRFYFETSQGNINLAMTNILEAISKGEVPVCSEIRKEVVCIDNNEMPCLCESMINATLNTEVELSNSIPEAKSLSTPKRSKKDKKMDETSLQLKRHIEQNFVIADKHYSPHCLKVRKMRRGEPMLDSNKEEAGRSSGSGTPAGSRIDDGCCCDCHRDQSDSNSDQEEEEEEKTINITLGMDLIKMLDHKFLANSSLEYPENIAPVVNMPESLAQQIHALWLESLGYQIDMQHKLSSVITKEDEELARKLTIQELEQEELGTEQPVPNLREIMDLELALNINREQMEKIKPKSPDDMASVMTKGKLYNLFPDMNHECLDEMLMAHDGSFVETVSSLLVSTGREDIVLRKDGLNKFIMNAELERQQKALEKERENSSWLGEVNDASSPANMETVTEYRSLAQQCLDIRNTSHQKAMEYMQRGMNGVASYYSNVASLNTQRYEHANSMAVTSLVEFHSCNNSNNTLDLHFLFVAEALQALDLFLDHHLSELSTNRRLVRVFVIVGRGTHSRGGPRIKPAVVKRLKQRNLKFTFINPGLLSTDLNINHQLTHQLT